MGTACRRIPDNTLVLDVEVIAAARCALVVSWCTSSSRCEAPRSHYRLELPDSDRERISALVDRGDGT